MNRFFIDEIIKSNDVFIPKKTLIHQLKNVLKIKKNESFILIFNEDEYMSNFDGKYIHVKNMINSKDKNIKNSKVILIQSFLKNSKIPFLIQKTIELGIDEIIFIGSKRSIPKLDDYIKKKDRLFSIAKESSEQTGRVDIPKISLYENINSLKLLDSGIKLISYEKQDISSSIFNIIKKVKISDFGNIYIFIGPEGGYDKKEIDYMNKLPNSWIISLGENILRSETAAIYVTGIINYETSK